MAHLMKILEKIIEQTFMYTCSISFLFEGFPILALVILGSDPDSVK